MKMFCFKVDRKKLVIVVASAVFSTILLQVIVQDSVGFVGRRMLVSFKSFSNLGFQNQEFHDTTGLNVSFEPVFFNVSDSAVNLAATLGFWLHFVQKFRP